MADNMDGCSGTLDQREPRSLERRNWDTALKLPAREHINGQTGTYSGPEVRLEECGAAGRASRSLSRRLFSDQDPFSRQFRPEPVLLKFQSSLTSQCTGMP
jgi:hypothetical protein